MLGINFCQHKAQVHVRKPIFDWAVPAVYLKLYKVDIKFVSWKKFFYRSSFKRLHQGVWCLHQQRNMDLSQVNEKAKIKMYYLCIKRELKH